jgi:MFS family permease
LIPTLCGLCLSAGFIAGSLAPFVPALMVDLRMTPATAGIALGAWQAMSAVASLPLGVWLDRIPLRFALGVGGGLAVLSCGLRAVAASGFELVGAVAIFGVAWTLVVGGSAKVIGTTFEGRSRHLAAGIVLACVNLGFAAVLALAAPVLSARLGGWRPALLATGAPMAATTVAWLLLARAPRPAPLARPSVGRDTLDLLRLRSVLFAMAPVLAAIAIGHGLSNWLPTLLRADGLTPTLAGLAAAAYIACGVAGALTLPVLATVRTRRWWVAGVLIVEALLIPALVVPSTALVGVALVVLGMATGSLPPLLILALFDTEGLGNRAGAVTGIYYTVAGLAGLSGPLVIGWLVDVSGGFGAGLFALTIAAVLGAVFGLQLGGARTGKAAVRQPELTVLP